MGVWPAYNVPLPSFSGRAFPHPALGGHDLGQRQSALIL